MKINIVAVNFSQTGVNPIWLMIIVGVVITIAAAVISNARAGRRRREAKLEAEERYQKLSAPFKLSPANTDLREKALAVGRHYASLLGDKKGFVIYDALMNDLNAVSGTPPLRQQTAPKLSIEERLA